MGDAIRAYLKAMKLEKPLKERELVYSWETLLGKTVARATKDIRIRDGILQVTLTSSVIRNELHMLKDEIIRKLNEAAGEELVREMELK